MLSSSDGKSKRRKGSSRNSQLQFEVCELSPRVAAEPASEATDAAGQKIRSRSGSNATIIESLGKFKRSLAAAISTSAPLTPFEDNSALEPDLPPGAEAMPTPPRTASPSVRSASPSVRSASPGPSSEASSSSSPPVSSPLASPQPTPSGAVFSGVESPGLLTVTPPTVCRTASKSLKDLLRVDSRALVRQESRQVVAASSSRSSLSAAADSSSDNNQYASPSFALEVKSMDDFYRAVGMSHWIHYERQLEQDWDTLLNRAFKSINLNSNQYQQYACTGPRADTCRKGVVSIQPWCSNRVVLCPLLASSADDPDPTFVNASPSASRFISAGMPQSVVGREAFWACCFQQRVKQIVMLNLPGEQENVPYWPHTRASGGFRDVVGTPWRYGHFVVTLIEVVGRNRPEIVHRRFRVDFDPLPDAPVAGRLDELPFGGKRSSVVEHHHYTDWPDMSVPDNKIKFITFFEDVVWIRKFHRRPVLVHCFGGAGRTGTFIAVAEMLFRLDLYKKGLSPKAPDLVDVILELRKHRPDQVQTQDQFKFVNRMVYNYVFPQDSHTLQALGWDPEHRDADDSDTEFESFKE